jgi:hypothetical protein
LRIRGASRLLPVLLAALPPVLLAVQPVQPLAQLEKQQAPRASAALPKRGGCTHALAVFIKFGSAAAVPRVGRWLLCVGCCLLAAVYWLLHVGCCVLAVAVVVYWLLSVVCWLLAIGYWRLLACLCRAAILDDLPDILAKPKALGLL